MKTKLTTLLLFFVSILSPTILNAQVKSDELSKNRIKVAYGDASYVSIADVFFGSLVGGSGDISTIGNFSVGYRWLTNNSRWALGGDFSYTVSNEKFNNGEKLSYNFFSIVPTAELYYIKSGICRLYGTVGVGPMISDDGAFGTAFQINPIALRIGNNKIAGFIELGVGYKGIANLGIEIGF
ncbi:MAG: hypothetical protein RR220_01070 [Bacteroidaceae bacterium]